MITKHVDDRVYFKSELLAKDTCIEHFFTTKCGGFSHGKIQGLNLGFRVGDNYDDVVKNYVQISVDNDIPFENITALKQIHSKDIKIITEDEKGFGVSRADCIFEADGLVTNCKNIPIMVYYADCVPMLLADASAKVVAAVHSGWRGTVLKTATNAAVIMSQKFGAKPENIKCAIGPSICKNCFETDEDVARQFDSKFVKPTGDGKFLVDLWAANIQNLKDAGVKHENIDVLNLCTMCQNDTFYSYRLNGDKTGRMGAVIILKQ